MSISALSGGVPTVPTPDPTEGVGKSELDQQDFMTLFITQLQYQDPMEPMDSYEMASQMAQFSNMEATMQMSANMERLLDYQTSQNNLQLLSLLDKEVQAIGNSIAVSEGETGRGVFNLVEASESVTIEIYNENNRLVRQIEMGSMQVGEFELDWDGMNSGGDQVADGLYSYVVDARNQYSEPVEVDYRMVGRVTGVQFDSGTAVVTLDDHVAISVSEVVQVLESSTEEQVPVEESTDDESSIDWPPG